MEQIIDMCMKSYRSYHESDLKQNLGQVKAKQPTTNANYDSSICIPLTLFQLSERGADF